jgi:hypothetical protein
MRRFFHPYAIHFCRIVFGLNFLVNGLNPFLHFYALPQPAPQAGAFAGALMATGYLFTFVKAVEIAVGALLIANRLVPLALVLIAPISVNIFLFNALLDPAAAPIGALVLALNGYLCAGYLAYYRPLLALKSSPGLA